MCISCRAIIFTRNHDYPILRSYLYSVCCYLPTEESYALKDEPTGLVGENGYYIPLYTGKSDPTLLSYLGLQGQENRAKLADTFRTPTTWKDYCSEVTNSTPTCEAGDPIADRAPKTEVESESYFVSDLYKGHFRILPENKCDDNPNSCKGHFVNPHCDRSTYAEMQMYWNNIALQSTGPLMPNSGECCPLLYL